jgi:predicted MFS family arabinose efflux permease
LVALPSVGGSYWTTFFPAFVVLGFGMAVSVAPLTTVVMSSVDQTRAGTASGINNAVSRVAGVLAVAILGIVMVSAFSHRLQRSLDGLDLAPGVLHQIQSSEIRLAGLEAPSDLDAQGSSALRAAISKAFVFGFRLIMLLCAGLAVASAAVASRMIPSRAAT